MEKEGIARRRAPRATSKCEITDYISVANNAYTTRLTSIIAGLENNF